jgi:2-haloacid dehalogenase
VLGGGCGKREGGDYQLDETFPIALERFAFMSWSRGIVVSGQKKLIKPDPEIYQLLVDRHGLRPDDIVYTDDNARNAAAASALRMHGIHFTGPAALRNELIALGLLQQGR